MRLVIIRHGEPDYSIDSLTPKGWREAELLSERIAQIENAHYYCSTMGRAVDTSRASIGKISERLGHEVHVEYCDWLREFIAKANDPITGEPRSVIWDTLPSWWTTQQCVYDKDKWLDCDYLKDSDAAEMYKTVTTNLDAVLEKHGYRREGHIYRPVRPNEDTLVFFCHFGVESVLLGHLLGMSPFIIWHSFIALPTSVTTLITEEREDAVAAWRCQSFGDVSHLYAAGEPVSFAGRFCELYTNTDQRH